MTCDTRWKKRRSDWQGKITRYGITLEQYIEMVAEQNGVCAICKKPETARNTTRLSIDHCHATGKVRGLLCQQCNKMLGMGKDNPETLQAAINYLNSTATNTT